MFLLRSESLVLQMSDCILQFWKIMGSMHIILKINVDFKKMYKKTKDVLCNICKGRDSEHRPCSASKLQNLSIQSVRKLSYSLNN